jgi:hypothetical protein
MRLRFVINSKVDASAGHLMGAPASTVCAARWRASIGGGADAESGSRRATHVSLEMIDHAYGAMAVRHNLTEQTR